MEKMKDKEILERWPFEVGQEVWSYNRGYGIINGVGKFIMVEFDKYYSEYLFYLDGRTAKADVNRDLFHTWEIEVLTDGGFKQLRPIGIDAAGKPFFSGSLLHFSEMSDMDCIHWYLGENATKTISGTERFTPSFVDRADIDNWIAEYKEAKA